MSKEHQPFTAGERIQRAQSARTKLGWIPDNPTFYEREAQSGSINVLRYEATLRQIEAERDAYGWIVRELLDDDSPQECLQRLRSRRLTHRQIERIGDALLTLQEEKE